MIQNLEWDSRFWGFPVGQLERSEHAVSSVDLTDLNAYTVVQSLIELNQPSVSQALVNRGFFPVDTRIEYQLRADRIHVDLDKTSAMGIELVDTLRDESGTSVFASTLAKSSRFNSFPASTDRVAMFYATWILNAQRGVFDDGLIVATRDNRPIALISYRDGDDALSIGLLAVHPSHQGQGIARMLIHNLIGLAHRRRRSAVKVVTEGCNIAAQRFYESAGFRVSNARLWMYRIHE